MASTAPPIIPISATTAGSGQMPQQPAAPINNPAFRQFISRFSDSIRASLVNQRPWHELVDRSAFSRPDSLSEATSRIRKNVSYFRINYIALFALTLAITLISNPFSLVVILALLASWCFLYLFRPSDSPLVIFGRDFSDRETLVGLVVLSVVALFLTSVASLLMSAVTVAVLIVGVHGAFRVPEDLFLDDPEGGNVTSGFLSFFGGAPGLNTAVQVPAGRV
ncbi:Prenylated rab acceptor family protein [Zostera marina]|uniref:PRA1 family protein n=1 Tax=Zostera marina TaxID=29655 RepID=A0A0K9PSC2_ZOSMR|nr:Prenylated rab acceptor family protein [Zostera marina]